jgi:hypothetical protein
MTPEAFRCWLVVMRERHGWFNHDAARALGCGLNMPGLWSRHGAPFYIGLACAALARGIPPWQRSLDG